MVMSRTLTVLFMLALVAAAGPEPLVAEEIRIGTGAAATENIFKKIQEPLEKATGVKLVVISNGPSEALKDLDKGSVQAAVGGLTFPDWMALMEKEGYAIADKSAYKNRVIGKDIVKVLVHKDVTVKQLSNDQLKAIFTGKATNWKEAGGPDLPIVVLLGSKIPGTQAVFQKQAMGGEPFTTVFKEGTTAEDLKSKLVATPGGVCVGAVSQIDGTVNAPEIAEFGRPITLLTKGEPSPGVLKMLEFIRGEGKKYIDK